jgi:translation initiation factor IF-3
MRNKPKHILNNQIRFSEIRIVGDEVEVGIYSTSDALKIAEDMGVDLVLLSDKSTPPICKIIDYKKFLYELDKKSKSQKSAPLKEIKLSPNIGEHDIEFKAKNAMKFLEDGSKIKLTMEFRGREMMFKEKGELTLLKFIDSLNGSGTAETLPKLEGKKIIVYIKPGK